MAGGDAGSSTAARRSASHDRCCDPHESISGLIRVLRVAPSKRKINLSAPAQLILDPRLISPIPPCDHRAHVILLFLRTNLPRTTRRRSACAIFFFLCVCLRRGEGITESGEPAFHGLHSERSAASLLSLKRLPLPLPSHPPRHLGASTRSWRR